MPKAKAIVFLFTVLAQKYCFSMVITKLELVYSLLDFQTYQTFCAGRNTKAISVHLIIDIHWQCTLKRP